MKEWLGIIILVGSLALDSSAAGRGPEVTNVDQKISISADDVTLGRLLGLWDQATGMQSIVPPELKNRKLSVHFKGLAVNDAVRKMFNEQPFDYVLVEGHGILVMERSQTEPVAQSADACNAVEQVTEPPVSQEAPSLIVPPPEQQQPIITQTPFGPIVSPYGGEQPVVQLPPVYEPPPAVLLPPLYGPPPPRFFALTVPPIPPAGAPNGPVLNTLFGPLPVYHDPIYVASTPY
jgi:hypothetical protein